jgi:hypothetical protein
MNHKPYRVGDGSGQIPVAIHQSAVNVQRDQARAPRCALSLSKRRLVPFDELRAHLIS